MQTQSARAYSATSLINVLSQQTQVSAFAANSAVRSTSPQALCERLKKSICLHTIRGGMSSGSVETVCQMAIEQLTAAMSFSETTSVMIELHGRQFVYSQPDEDVTHSLQARITANGEGCGWLRVLRNKNEPFLLLEEQSLIDSVAYDLGRWLENRQFDYRAVEMATHDALTGLPNRRLLRDRIALALARGHRNHNQVAVLFIDLDHFKTINDTRGHDVGDIVLKEVAARLIAAVRGEDTVARQGGDDFIVLLAEIAATLDAETVAQKILRVLMQPFQINGEELHIGGNIGIALFPSNGEDVDTLLKNSDIALFHAKRSGQKNCQFFVSEMSC